MKKTDDIQQIMKLQTQISEALRKDNGVTVHFEFSVVKGYQSEVAPLPGHFSPEDRSMAQAFTYNPAIEEFFLLYSAVADSKVQALKMILAYVKTHKKSMDSYTVRWMRKDDPNMTEQQVSYFYCNDMQEVLEKFYAGKDKEKYKIYELKLNPMS